MIILTSEKKEVMRIILFVCVCHFLYDCSKSCLRIFLWNLWRRCVGIRNNLFHFGCSVVFQHWRFCNILRLLGHFKNLMTLIDWVIDWLSPRTKSTLLNLSSDINWYRFLDPVKFCRNTKIVEPSDNCGGQETYKLWKLWDLLVKLVNFAERVWQIELILVWVLLNYEYFLRP